MTDTKPALTATEAAYLMQRIRMGFQAHLAPNEMAALRMAEAALRAQGEPVAWWHRVENGNIRIWTSAEDVALRLAREEGLDMQPLYAAPQTGKEQ